MGISKGHTFTDGETVTAAKLNNLVDNATITSDTVTTAMVQNNAITADKLATDAVTGANIASNSINLTSLSNASGGTSGTIVQSGAGGVFEEFTPGSAGTFLKSAGSDASLTWGTVDSTGVDATMISGHTEITSPGEDDLLLVKDKVAGVNKSLQIQNLYKTVSDLTLLGSSDVADADEYLVIDGANPKKITQANLQTATLTSVNGLTALTDTTVADDDVLLVYDTSTSTVKKIAKSDLLYGTSRYLASGQFVCNSSGPSVTSSWTTNIASVTHNYAAANNSRVDITFTNPVSAALPIFVQLTDGGETGGLIEVQNRTTTGVRLNAVGSPNNPTFVFYIPTDV